jgi:uncharacterized protein
MRQLPVNRPVRSRSGALAIVGAGLVAAAAAQQIPSRPASYVVDLANVVDADSESRLNTYLGELERKTTAQMVVLTVPTADGDVADLAVRTFKKWQLGDKDKDNGVLIVVAVQDRRAKIEVGYGLEPVLTDAFTGRIGREVFAPHFKQGNYGAGLYEGVLVLANKIAGEAGVQISGMPARRLSDQPTHMGVKSSELCWTVGPLFAVLILLGMLRGRRGRYHRRWGGADPLFWMVLGNVLSSGGRTWGGRSGGGSWGGGSGGFGGGGGGSSGGGGASFGW